MADEKKKRSEEAFNVSNADTSTSEDIRKRFEDTYNDYIQSLSEAHMNGQTRYEDEYKNYLQALNDAQMSAKKCLEDTNRNYLASMQEAWGQEDAQVRAEKAYRDGLKCLQEGRASLEKDCELSHQKYIETCQQVWKDTQDLNLKACLNYLQVLQKAWAEMDVKAIDAITITTIIRTINAANGYISYALQTKT